MTDLKNLIPIKHEFVRTANEFDIACCAAIAQDQMVILFSEHTTHWVSRAIVWRTKRRKEHRGYSHTMVGYLSNYQVCGTGTPIGCQVASQGWLLSSQDLNDRYLQGDHRLKAWVIDTPESQAVTIGWVKSQLARPWYRRRYNWLGIVGQAINVRALSAPWSYYCSQFVGAAIKGITGRLPFGKYPNPNDINRALKRPLWPDNAKPRVLARYDPTIDVDAIPDIDLEK